ncbi:hypothetical protein TNCV_4377611 [Trichonephila clavipes]|nr:hypothetical protein TNCV_4377611 [Trichonephila clavipes]
MVESLRSTELGSFSSPGSETLFNLFNDDFKVPPEIIEHLPHWRSVGNLANLNILDVVVRLSFRHSIYFQCGYPLITIWDNTIIISHNSRYHIGLNGNEIADSLDKSATADAQWGDASLIFAELFPIKRMGVLELREQLDLDFVPEPLMSSLDRTIDKSFQTCTELTWEVSKKEQNTSILRTLALGTIWNYALETPCTLNLTG